MSTIIENLTLLFENPKKFAYHLMTDRNFGFGFLGYFVGSLSLFVWQYLNKGQITATEFIFMLASAFCFNIAVGIILSAVINIFMDITGSKGSATGAFIILGVADFVKILLVPAAILLYIFTPYSIFSGVILFFAMILQFVFTIYMLRYGYKCSTIKALISYSIPYMGAIFLFFLFVTSAIVGLLS